MDSQDRRNVQRIIRVLAKDWKCPTWNVIRIIQQEIDRNWEKSMQDQEKKALWDQYFPDGKPTSELYILWLGRAHERGETMPYLFTD